jgi:hypothetical protein
MTDYAGIDYGMGRTNIDPETGIRYGVIRLNSLSEYAIEDFEPDYGEPHCPKCGNEAETIPSHTESDPSGKGKWVSVMQDIPEEMAEWENGGIGEYACRSCEYLFDSDEAFGDSPICHTLDKDGYQATLDEYNDVFLVKSPYYTHAQFCSPCAPGAGHLDNPCELGPETYCFGHDWFADGKAPYPVYRVSDGATVVTPRDD